MFAIALNDREYMLKAAKREDAELWVTKLNMLKSQPNDASSNGSKEENQKGNVESGVAGNEGKSRMSTAEIEMHAGTRQSNSKTWSKMKRLRLCC